MRYTQGAIEAAANLSNRYIQDRFLPDKAIDLIDEAGARARIAANRAPEPVARPSIAWRSLRPPRRRPPKRRHEQGRRDHRAAKGCRD